jgi:L-malate glycosyltransferase
MNIRNYSHKNKPVVLQIVAHGLPDKLGRRSTNGPEIRALRSLDYHNKKRFKFIVCYSREGNLWDDFKRCEDIELIGFSVESKFQLSAIAQLISIIKENKVDIVHTQGPASSDFFAAVAAKIMRIPLVVARPNPELTKSIYRIFDKFSFGQSSYVITTSKTGVKDLIEKHKLQPAKAIYIYNGVVYDDFCSLNIDKTKDHPLCIGTCAQFTKYKGWPDFLRVLDLCRREIVGLKSIIVGDGPMRDEIFDRAVAIGLSDLINFIGFQKDVRPYLKQMDIFLMTSWTEGLPVALIEAMAAALPVVATDVGGISELVVHGESGFVGPPKNPEILATYVLKLLKNRELRAQFGLTGRERVKDLFSIKKMVEEYEKIYSKILV